jgi:hypothetical protein
MGKFLKLAFCFSIACVTNVFSVQSDKEILENYEKRMAHVRTKNEEDSVVRREKEAQRNQEKDRILKAYQDEQRQLVKKAK